MRMNRRSGEITSMLNISYKSRKGGRNREAHYLEANSHQPNAPQPGQNIGVRSAIFALNMCFRTCNLRLRVLI